MDARTDLFEERLSAAIAHRGAAQAEAEDDGESGLRQHGFAIATGVVALALVAAGYLFFRATDDLPPPVKVQEVTLVNITPPPPPPQPMPEQKMIEQTPVKQQEIEEQKPIEQPKDEVKPLESTKHDEPPPGPLALDAKPTAGPGDAFGLGGKPGGHGLIGGGGGGGSSGGSRWGWYASMVQTQIESALRANSRTRSTMMQMRIHLWADQGGRVNRIQIISSSGNPEIDSAIQNEVLAGLTLREPPPKDMPMPIVMRITTRRPS